MVVTRSMSGATKKADTKIAVNHKAAERASKRKWMKERKEALQTWMKERKETFLKQFRDKYPDIKISPNVIDSREKVWLKLSMTASDIVAEFEKSLALDLILEAFTEDYIKEVNGAKSGTTVERPSKAQWAQIKKRIRTSEWQINDNAYALFLVAFEKKVSEKYPDIVLKYNGKVLKAERKAWSSMTDRAKAPYIAQVEKRLADELAFLKMYCG